MKTKWLVIGNSKYNDPGIEDVPAVCASVDLLCNSIGAAYGKNADILLEKDLDNSQQISKIDDFFENIEHNTFPILYFCGHGFRKNNELFLAAKDSPKRGIEHCSVAYTYIRDCIRRNHLSYAAIILDCCFSGTANGLSIDGECFTLPEVDYLQSICFTSCKGSEEAYLKEVGGSSYAAFTYHFAQLLCNGIPGRGRQYSFNDMCKEIQKKLDTQEPTVCSTGSVSSMEIIPNRCFASNIRPTLFKCSESNILRVLLVKSSIEYPIKKNGDFGVPLGLWLLKSYIQRTSANIQIDIFDERLRKLQNNTQSFEECIQEYDVIGTSMCSCEVPPSLEKMRIAHENQKITIAGGIFTYSNEDYLLNYPFVDFVIPGVGTKPLEQLLTELRKRKERDFKGWKNTVWKQIEDGTLETTGLRNVFSRANKEDAVMWDAATMPHIELDIWDEIINIYGPYLNKKIDIYTARGCNKTCTFCSVQRETKHNVISCDESQVIRIIEHLYNRGMRRFSIKDEDFLIEGPSRITNILGKFKNYDGIAFKVRSRIDSMLTSKLSSSVLSEYHISEIQYGVESPSSEMRRYVQKEIKKSSEDVVKLFKDHNENGIVVNASFILGLPGENVDYYESLVSFIRQIYTPNLTKVYLNFYTPHPTRGKIPDDVCVVTNDLNYYTHKIPVCFPKAPKMKPLVKQKMLSAYTIIVEETHSRDFNPVIPKVIAQLFKRDEKLLNNEIMKYGGDGI